MSLDSLEIVDSVSVNAEWSPKYISRCSDRKSLRSKEERVWCKGQGKHCHVASAQRQIRHLGKHFDDKEQRQIHMHPYASLPPLE